MAIRKEFSEGLYKRFDHPAKMAVSRLLKKRGHTVMDDEDYGADLCSFKNGKPLRHETEIKQVWDGAWPPMWKTIQIPERKVRLLDNCKDLFFWIIKEDLTQAWVIHSDKVREAPRRMVRNKYIASGEYFMQVPIEDATLVDL